MGAARGALIGLIGGVLTGAVELLCLGLYSVARPDDRLGSTAAPGPIMGGFFSSVLGIVLGAILGAIVEAAGLDLRGLKRCVLFGVIVVGSIGGFIGLAQVVGDNSNRPPAAAAFLVGLIVIRSLVGGASGGATAGLFTRHATPVEHPASIP